MIALIGSVFSPYYARARRRGIADPREHCAMNVALYGRGVRRWAMTERGQRALHLERHALRIGRSAMRWENDALVVDIDEWAVPVLRPVRGTIRLMPSGLSSYRAPLDPQGRHRWAPLAPAARVEVRFDQPGMAWKGHGYFDSNAGDEPLEAAFRSWTWSRAATRGGAAILYDCIRRKDGLHSLALKFDTHGEHREFSAPLTSSLPDTLIWRMRRSTRSEGADTALVVRTLEDTPFYARSMIRSRLLGEDCVAMHESLSLDRFDTAWVQALLPFRMPRRSSPPRPR